jgi:hypothetical protein
MGKYLVFQIINIKALTTTNDGVGNVAAEHYRVQKIQMEGLVVSERKKASSFTGSLFMWCGAGLNCCPIYT